MSSPTGRSVSTPTTRRSVCVMTRDRPASTNVSGASALLYVAPTEPAAIRRLGKVTNRPERYGADVMGVVTRGQRAYKWGVQRKEVGDLLASVGDGRLGKELLQMQRLDHAMVVVEGDVRFGGEELLGRGWGRRWTLGQVKAVLWGVREMGVWVETSEHVEQTADVVRLFAEWVGKDEHGGLLMRPKAKTMFGTTMRDDDFAEWMLQGLPGVGPKLARRIRGELGDVLDLKVGVEELMGVEGVGKRTAERIVSVFGRT